MTIFDVDQEFTNGRISFANSVSAIDIIDSLELMSVQGADVLLAESTTEAIQETFPLNSLLQQVIEESNLSVSAVEEPQLPTIAMVEDKIEYKLTLGSVEQFVKIPRNREFEEFVAEFDALVSEGTMTVFDAPPWEMLLSELEEDVGEDTRLEFERLILAAQHEGLGALDETSVAVIAAAQSGALQYDLAKWAEEIGLASRATVSRRKTSLEKDGVIVTESVPVEVGRPRERLHLSDDGSRVEVDGAPDGSKLDISMQSPSGRVDSHSSSTTSESTAATDATSSGSVDASEPSFDSGNKSDILTTMEEEIQDVLRSS